jgi:phage shock protein PspC (stress-responsive transcriptional regulator)
MIAGVCGGMEEEWGIDATITRALFVLLTLFGGGGILVYVIMWVVIPEGLPTEKDDDAGEFWE